MYLGIDLGTSSVKTLLVDEDQNILGSASYELTVNRPHASWSEQDANSWIHGIEATFTQLQNQHTKAFKNVKGCLLYTSPSPRDKRQSRMPSSA